MKFHLQSRGDVTDFIQVVWVEECILKCIHQVPYFSLMALTWLIVNNGRFLYVLCLGGR